MLRFLKLSKQQWVLFLILFILGPIPFFVFVVGGLTPPIYSFLRVFNLSVLIIFLEQLFVTYIVVQSFRALVLHGLKTESRKWKIVILFGVCLFILSFFKIYSYGDTESSGFYTFIELHKELPWL